MSQKAIALRYAKPLLELAREQGILDKVQKNMEVFKETLENSRDLSLVLKSPVIKSDKKFAVLKAIFSGKVEKLTMSIFEIMSRKNRENILLDLSKQFTELYNIEKGIQHVEVKTAVKLSEALLQELQEKLAKELDKTIILKETVEADLVGGFIIQIENSQIDNSIKHSLQRLKMNFIQKVYN